MGSQFICHPADPERMEKAYEWIRKGRSGVDRPNGNNRRIRAEIAPRELHRGLSNSPALSNTRKVQFWLHATPVVTWYENGVSALTTNGWNTQMTLAEISQYTSARVYRHKHRLYAETLATPYTAPKIWKCRTCKNRGTTSYQCHPPTCWEGTWTSEPQECPKHPGQMRGHINGPCHHGEDERHEVYQKCWRCEGTGMADYGSKPVHYDWTGETLLVQETFTRGYPLFAGQPLNINEKGEVLNDA